MAITISNIKNAIGGALGRFSKAKPPEQKTVTYAMLQKIGGGAVVNKSRPMIKPTPANLRAFAKTTYCRRAINAVKNRLVHLEFEIAPIKGVEISPLLQKQIDAAWAALNHPNHDDTLRTLLEQACEDILIFGHGCWEQQPSADAGRPAWLWPVDAQSIQVFPLWTGNDDEARYAQDVGYGKLNLLRNEELCFMRLNPSTASPFGLGPVEIAFKDVARLLDARESAGNIVGNTAPANIIGLVGANQDQVDAFRAYWEREIEGQGRAPIVGVEAQSNGSIDVKVVPLHRQDDSALYLEWQKVLIRSIATAFDLSPANLGMEEHQNRATAEVAEERDMDSAVRPLAALIAAHITREVIQGVMNFPLLTFKALGLDRDDEKAGADVYKVKYESNAITPNQYRESINQPPLDSPIGDLLYSEVQQLLGASAVKAADKKTPNQEK